MFIKETPLLNVEATNPPISVTTPPPRFIIKLFLSAPSSESLFQRIEQVFMFLLISPSGISKTLNDLLNEVFLKKSGKQSFLVLVSTKIKIVEGFNSLILLFKESQLIELQ